MPPRAAAIAADLEPMYATTADAVPAGGGWVFEPKYDGVRVLAHVAGDVVRLVTRNGRDKAAQFPEIGLALRALARRRGRALVLDGEIVALAGDEPARFQALQRRTHLADARGIERLARSAPAALVAFDLLADGDEPLLDRPWRERRRRLARVLGRAAGEHLRLGESLDGTGEALLAHARRAGWEGLIAKRDDAPYRPGLRSRDWRKLKVEHRQELVVGGWTEPRRTRPHLGALLLGYYDGEGRLRYAGHAGGGFTHEGLRLMRARLERLARRTPPFAEPPAPNETVHWVRPEVVVEVRFAEWTADGRLRQPIVLGVRDDKPAREVVREPESVQGGTASVERRGASVEGRPDPSPVKDRTESIDMSDRNRGGAKRAAKDAVKGAAKGGAKRSGASTNGSKRAGTTSATKRATKKVATGVAAHGATGASKRAAKSATKSTAKNAAKSITKTTRKIPAKSAAKRTPQRATNGAAKRPARGRATSPADTVRRPTLRSAQGKPSDAQRPSDLLAQLDAIEARGGDGTVTLPDGGTLDLTSLGRVIFPEPGFTKGDLLRYYARVAPALLPILADRPLVLRRFPRGVEGPSFFQQNAPEAPPAAVRAEDIENDAGERQHRFVGGDLGTLLYTVQIGAISVDPWNARVGHFDRVDYAVLDLDPGDGVPFATVVAVARLVRDALERLGLPGRLKTSGKRGLHVFVPFDDGIAEREAVALAKRIATRVAKADPAIATVERSVAKRRAGAVYVDYLQNIVAKPVAAAYCVRATPQASVSTPLAWEELTDDLDPRRFTIATVPERLERLGDLWGIGRAG